MSWLASLIAMIVAALAKVFIAEAKKPKNVTMLGGDDETSNALDDDIADSLK